MALRIFGKDDVNVNKKSPGGPIKLDAVMIVKNEEKNIGRCLESLQGLVDEIFIEDTGSTDKTIEIAESYGAWVHRNTWKNDFAYHRNSVIEKATGDWLLSIDADETVSCTDIAHLRRLLSLANPNICFGKVLLSNMQKGQPGLFMTADRLIRKGFVSFEGACHERLSSPARNVIDNYLMVDGLQIIHYGYDVSKEELDLKRTRNREILMKMLREKKQKPGTPIDPQLYRDIIQNLASSKLYEHATKLAEEYRRAGNQMDHDTAYTIFQVYMLLEDYKAANKWLNLGMSIFPDAMDMNYNLYHWGKVHNDPDSVIAGGRNWLRAFHAIAPEPGKYDASKLIGRTLFTFTPDHLLEVLANLCTAQITTGIDMLGMIRGPLEQEQNEARKNQIMDHLTRVFDKFKREAA